MPPDAEVATATLREELMQVVVALWHEIDHHRGVRASAYFTTDAELRFENARFRGRAQIDEVYATRAARGPRVSRHVVTNMHVVDAGGDTAHVLSTLILYAEDGTAPRPNTAPALVAESSCSRTTAVYVFASTFVVASPAVETVSTSTFCSRRTRDNSRARVGSGTTNKTRIDFTFRHTKERLRCAADSIAQTLKRQKNPENSCYLQVFKHFASARRACISRRHRASRLSDSGTPAGPRRRPPAPPSARHWR